MKMSRRGWNNLLILAIIASMLILNLPTLIKNYLVPPEQASYPYVLNPEVDIKLLNFADWSIQRHLLDWQSSKPLTISPLELVQRWQGLNGTVVDDQTFSKLKPNLPSANTLEVWYADLEEPQRVTYYQTPSYWLMKSWQQQWIAISVEQDYLFPFH
jgi:hypothetical protein